MCEVSSRYCCTPLCNSPACVSLLVLEFFPVLNDSSPRDLLSFPVICFMVLRQISYWSLGWPQNQYNPPASGSHMLRLQVSYQVFLKYFFLPAPRMWRGWRFWFFLQGCAHGIWKELNWGSEEALKAAAHHLAWPKDRHGVCKIMLQRTKRSGIILMEQNASWGTEWNVFQSLSWPCWQWLRWPRACALLDLYAVRSPRVNLQVTCVTSKL